MSTWDEPCYITDTLGQLLKYAEKTDETSSRLWKYFGYEIPTFEGTTLKEANDLHTYKGLQSLFPNAFLYNRKNESIIPSLLDLCDLHKSVKFGLAAVYPVWKLFYDGDIKYTSEIDFTTINEYVARTSELDLYASFMTPKRIKETIDLTKIPTKAYSHYRTCIESAYTINRIAYFHRAHSYSDQIRRDVRDGKNYPYISPKTFDFGKETKIWSMNGFMIISTKARKDEHKTLYILEMKTVRRVSQVLRSTGKLISYFSMQSKRLNAPKYLDDCMYLLEYMMESAAKTTRPSEMARAMDVIYFTALASYSQDVSDISYKLQLEKYSSNKYDKIISLEEFFRKLSPYKMYEKLDALKAYKILPCPDFNPHTGFLNMKQYHMNQNTVGTMTKMYTKHSLSISISDFEEYRILLYVNRYYARHNRCPGRLTEVGKEVSTTDEFRHLISYPEIKASYVKQADVKYIDIKGSAMWEDVDNNSPENYQDKACPPQTIDLTKIRDSLDFQKLSFEHRTLLGWYLRQPDIPPGFALRWSFLHDHQRSQQTAHFKPESKKPDPRNFYSATPYFRRVVSELEQNVRRYLEHDVAATLSKNPHDLGKQMQRVLGSPLERDRYRMIFVSFDIEKWSPKMPKRIKDMTIDFWANLFDQPYLEGISHAYKDVHLHFIHEGIHQDYHVNQVDFEGQTGTMNTAFHTEMMSYAVRQLRKKKLLKEPARFAVLIDDGLLALPFPKGTTNDVVNSSMEIIEAVYNYFGFTISWDKTFVSEHLSTFLNEIYYDGLNVTTGVKAFLKMQPTKIEDELSFVGKIKGLTSMAMGSIKAGLPPPLAKVELHREIFMLLSRTLRGANRIKEIGSETAALFMFTPVALGGMGVPLLMNITSSPNVDPIGNFTSAAYYIAQSQRALRPVLSAILTQDLRVRRSIDVLRSPGAVRINGKTFTEMKHIQYVLMMVRNLADNTFLKPLLHVDFDKLGESLMLMLGQEPTEQEVQVMYNMSPIAIVDKFLSKFKRSSTMMMLLSPRMRTKLLGRYMVETNAIYTQFITKFSLVK